MNILLVNEKAEQYAENFSTLPEQLLHKVVTETIATHEHAQMLSSTTQGKFLELLSMMIRPKKILEIGTFTGFSALCLVKGLAEGGMLHTIELREEDASKARGYFNESINRANIQLHVGDARSILPTLNETWDLVFIDADKVSYIEYYELTLQSLKQGGWIIADNVLFHGQVLEDEVRGKNAKAIHAFNEHVKNDSRVEQVMLTVRDGLLIIKKI